MLGFQGQVRVSRVRGFKGLTQLAETWPKSMRPTCQMPTKWVQPSDRWCLDSRGQVTVSRVRVFRVNSVSSARHRGGGGGQPCWPKSSLNPGDPLVGS